MGDALVSEIPEHQWGGGGDVGFSYRSVVNFFFLWFALRCIVMTFNLCSLYAVLARDVKKGYIFYGFKFFS